MTNYIDTGKANLYFVDLAFLGDDSLTASAATYCADEQGDTGIITLTFIPTKEELMAAGQTHQVYKTMQIF